MRRLAHRSAALGLVALVVAGCVGGRVEPADLVFTGGLVYTMDASAPRAEAVGVRGGRIVYVGDAQGAARLVGAGTEVVDLGGRMLLPGFHNTHVHLVSGGIELGECDLNPAASRADVVRIVSECAARDPDVAWIRGGGFPLPIFPDGAPPRALLDSLVPDRPAYITSADAHTAWVNSRALEAAGITAATPDPAPDGVIVRTADGEPQGTLRESAMGLVEQHLPSRSDAEVLAGLERGLAMAASFGITTVHEASAGEAFARAYAEAEARGLLTARAIIALRVDPTRA